MRLLSTVAVAVTALGLGFGNANGSIADDPKGASATVQRAVTLLTTIASMACTTHCSYLNCSLSQHENKEHANPDDGGEVHSCAMSSNGCADHNCNQTDSVEELAKLLPHLEGAELLALAESSDRLILNKQRKAAQVLGCSDGVLVSKRLTSSQLESLGMF